MSTELDLEQLHRLSPDDYHRIVEAGVFEDARIELIDGLLATMSPRTREHGNAVEWLTRWLVRAVNHDRFSVRVQSGLTLARSEPEPDLAVIPNAAPRPYHPATAALVIEVSMSSLRRDLVQKPSIYAGAGVEEYWVVDLEGRRVVVYRDPRPGGYAEAVEVRAGGRVTPASVSVGSVAVEELLAAAAA